jgi:benzoate transport
MSMAQDAATLIAQSRMSRLQIFAIGLCVALNALDGFDILSISFAAPGIASQWGIDRAALGLVLSMELIGMGVGSVVIGAVADRHGRRISILASLAIMALGMLLAAGAQTVAMLSAYRLVTGLGIGGMLACTNAMVAELASDRLRNICVTIMASGFPIGAALGGTVASLLLRHYGWPAIFLFGAAVSGAMLPLAWLGLPESVSFLARQGTAKAHAQTNRILVRMGHAPLSDWNEAPARPRPPLVGLFQPGIATITILLSLIYFTHIITFYFILKWLPKVVADMGFAPSSAGLVLVWANVGGALGALAFSLLSRWFGLRSLVLAALLLAAVMVALFGQVAANLAQISLLAGGAGFFTNGAVVGIYALVANYFPTPLRAGGTGFVIGIGRSGAALGPVIAGLLFADGISLPAVAALMAAGSLVAAAGLLALPRSAPGLPLTSE